MMMLNIQHLVRSGGMKRASSKCRRSVMRLIEKLTKKWGNAADPFLIHPSGQLSFSEVSKQKPVDLMKYYLSENSQA